MMKVLIIDDHKSMCDSLTFALEGTGDFSVVGTLANADYADIFCERLKPDLVFMDVCTTEGASGLDATKIIRQKYPDIKVVVMSGFDEIAFAARAVEVGAHAFVFKGSSLIRFVDIAKGVMEDKAFVVEYKSAGSPAPEGGVPFTEPEMEVLQLMSRHMTCSEIAKELSIEEDDVARHRADMLAAAGFDKVVDLVFHAHSKGWIRND